MVGHGSEAKEISPHVSGMNESTFMNLLNFFKTNVNTNTLFVISCFSAGKRMHIIKTLNLPYILIIAALTDTVTYRYFNYFFKINDDKNLELKFPQNISTYFNILKEGGGISYFDLLNYAQKFWKENLKQDLRFYKTNIPQIKLPNTEWFQVVDLQKNEFDLNRLMIDLYEHSKKPIIINNKRVLFLHTTYKYEQAPLPQKKTEITISPTLELRGERIPLFISMEPIDAKYNFEAVNAEDFALSYLLLKIIGMPTQKYNRTFNIKSLTVKKFDQTKAYRGSKADAEIFSKLFLSQGKLRIPPGTNTTLQNITIKVKPLGEIPKFRIKFEYNNQRYIIEEVSYQNIKKILMAQSFEYLAQLQKSIKIKPLKKNEKYIAKSKANKNFQAIEETLRKKREEQIKLKQPRISDLQILSQTLNSLSFYHSQIIEE